MKIMRTGATFKVEVTYDIYERYTEEFDYAVDTLPPMNNETYSEWRKEVSRMISDDIMKTEYGVVDIRIIYTYYLNGTEYMEDLTV